MKPSQQQIIELCVGMGWTDLGVQKNPYMLSFVHEEKPDRINVYFTTMTVTRQNRNIKNGFCHTYKNVTLEELESLL